MNSETFQTLAQQKFNRIPVVREVLADLETPLSCYQKLADGPYSYLLESVTGGEKQGRYSIIGLPCQTVLKVYGKVIKIEHKGALVTEETVNDPLEFVETFKATYRAPDIEGLPRFNGGLVGYFSYDTIRYIEKSLATSNLPDPLGTPDILLMVSDELLVFDNVLGSLFIIVHQDPSQGGSLEQAQARIDELQAQLNKPLPPLESTELQDQLNESDFVSDFKEEDYAKAVETVKDYILDGDAMQVVLSLRREINYEASPLSLYRALRYLNPSPYLYFFNLGDFHIVGSSPEILARVEKGEVSLRPIAGTRRRGKDQQEDHAMEHELLADPKELAEHLMLIDLGRNDLGRVCETGTVTLTDKMIVERYSHVMHIVSNVKGIIKPEKTAIDVLKASLPAGTLSGAPKVRAMEIIEELETVKRGIYGGAVGYLSWQGDMDTAIAIRTAVIKDKKLYIQAGGGLVADSIPRLEWKETMNKSRAIFRAVEMVLRNLSP